MVELVHRDQPVIERLDAKLLYREAEGGMGADQHAVIAGEELADRPDLGGIDALFIRPRRVAQVPLWLHRPIRPEAEFRERLVRETAADRLLRHNDDRLFQPLIVQLVERDKHQCARLPRGGRRLDQQILLTPLVVGALLHLAHAHRVGLGGDAGAGSLKRDGGYGLGGGHFGIMLSTRFMLYASEIGGITRE